MKKVTSVLLLVICLLCIMPAANSAVTQLGYWDSTNFLTTFGNTANKLYITADNWYRIDGSTGWINTASLLYSENWSDYLVENRLRLVAGPRITFLLKRVSGRSTSYYLKYENQTDGTSRIFLERNGATPMTPQECTVTLSTQPILADSAEHDFNILMRGNQFVVFIDGVQVATLTDPDNIAETGCFSYVCSTGQVFDVKWARATTLDKDTSLSCISYTVGEDTTYLMTNGVLADGVAQIGSIFKATKPSNTQGVPVVSATAASENATVEITQPQSFDGTAIIVVTAADGATQTTYNLKFERLVTGPIGFFNPDDSTRLTDLPTEGKIAVTLPVYLPQGAAPVTMYSGLYSQGQLVGVAHDTSNGESFDVLRTEHTIDPDMADVQYKVFIWNGQTLEPLMMPTTGADIPTYANQPQVLYYDDFSGPESIFGPISNGKWSLGSEGVKTFAQDTPGLKLDVSDIQLDFKVKITSGTRFTVFTRSDRVNGTFYAVYYYNNGDGTSQVLFSTGNPNTGQYPTLKATTFTYELIPLNTEKQVRIVQDTNMIEMYVDGLKVASHTETTQFGTNGGFGFMSPAGHSAEYDNICVTRIR